MVCVAPAGAENSRPSGFRRSLEEVLCRKARSGHPRPPAIIISGLRPTALLPLQLPFEICLPFCQLLFIAVRVDPDTLSSSCFRLFELLQHVEITSMRPQKDVAGQPFQDYEGVLVIIGNPRIRRGLSRLIHQSETRV